MASLNLCQFIGNVGRDPEIRYSAGGDPIANLSIGVSWKTGDKAGTEWVRVSAFGKLAEIIGEYVKKGSPIYISGRMQTRKWQDKSGEDRYTTEIIADRMQMIGSKGDKEQPKQQRTTGGDPNFDDMDDSIPF